MFKSVIETLPVLGKYIGRVLDKLAAGPDGATLTLLVTCGDESKVIHRLIPLNSDVYITCPHCRKVMDVGAKQINRANKLFEIEGHKFVVKNVTPC